MLQPYDSVPFQMNGRIVIRWLACKKTNAVMCNGQLGHSPSVAIPRRRHLRSGGKTLLHLEDGASAPFELNNDHDDRRGEDEATELMSSVVVRMDYLTSWHTRANCLSHTLRLLSRSACSAS